MKQKLLLPLLLALLTCLGVQAQTVVFNNWTGWSGVPTSASATPSKMTKSLDGKSYTLTVASTLYLNNANSVGLTVNGSNNNPPSGYIDFPSFGKKVSAIVVKVSETTYTAGKIGLYDLASPTPKTAIAEFPANVKGGTLTFEIPSDKQTSYALYELRNTGTGGTSIESISVTYAEGQSAKQYVAMSLSAYEVSALLGRPFKAPTLTTNPSVGVTWSSSATSVATVDASGNVTLVGAGKAVIKATYAGNSTYYGETISYSLTVADPTSDNGIVYNFSEMGFADNAAVGTDTPKSYTHEQGVVTLTFAKGLADYQPNYGASGGYVRFYTNNTLKVSAIDGYIIDRVEFVNTENRNYLNGVSESTPGTFTPASKGVNAVWKLLDLQISEATMTAAPTTSPALFTKVIVYLALKKLPMEASKDPIGYQSTQEGINALSNIDFKGVDTKNLTFTYESDSPDVVTINSTGVMEFHQEGSAKITVKFAGNDYYSANEASFTVNVSGNPVPTIDFTGNTSKLDLNLVTNGERSTYNLKANTTVKLGSTVITDGLMFESDNADVASVDSDGLITAHSAGTAVITVTVPAATGRDMATANFTVTVIDNRVAPAISYAEKSEAYYIGVDEFPMEDVDLQTLTGATDDEVDISVSFAPESMGEYSGGKLTLNGTAGTATVTATYPASEVNLAATASYKILVVDPKAGIVLNPASLGIQNGKPVTTVVSDTKLATFAFKSTGYFMASGGKEAYVNMSANGSLTVSAGKDYVIDHIDFTGAGFTETNNKVSSGKLDSTTGKWTFEGLNVNSATITNEGTTAIKIENVTVYLRKRIFVISTIEGSISKLNIEKDSQEEAVTVQTAGNFKVTLGDETLSDIALNYSISADEEGKEPATVGEINPTTGVVTLTKGATGTNYVMASFVGNETYGPAKPAVFSLVVTEKEPVVFTFNPVEDQNIFADKTIALTDVINSMTANGENVDLNMGTLSAVTDKEAVTYDNDKRELVIAASKDYSNADVPNETVKVTVTFTPNDDYDDKLAKSTGVFTFTLTDQRETPVFAYAKSYNFKASDFAAPQPFDKEYESIAADVNLKCDNSSLITENGTYANYTDLVGVQKGVVTATFAGNASYKPAKTTFDLTVTGKYMTVEEFKAAGLTAGSGVVIEGYIIGCAGTSGSLITNPENYERTNICIASNPEETSSYVIVALDGTYQGNYNLLDKPQYYKAFVQISGSAQNYRNQIGVGSITAMSVLKAVNIVAENATINAKESIVIGVPEGYNGDLTVEVLKDGNTPDEGDYTVTGYKYTFLKGGVYTLKLSAPAVISTNGWQAVENLEFTVTVIGKIQYLPDGRTFISSDMLDENGKFFIVEDSAAITYSIDGEASQPYNSTDGVSFGESKSGSITFTSGGVSDTYEYNFDTRDVNIAFIVAPTSQMEGTISYQFSDKNGVIASGEMTRYAEVGFDKQQYIATVVVPVSSFEDYEGQNIRENQNATSEVKASDENVYFQQPDPKNIVKPFDSDSKSPFSIVFSCSENDSEVAFIQTPVAYGSFEQIYNGTTQTIINGMNYTESDVYTPMYVIDWNTDEMLAEIAHAPQASAINNWIGNVKLDANTKFYYATAIDANSHAAGTFFGVANEQSIEDYMPAPSQVRMKRAAGDAQTLIASTDKAAIQPITNGDQTEFKVALNLAKGDSLDNGNYIAGYGVKDGDIQTGVEDVTAEDGEVMWFNLQGERIAEPSEGIVIRVQGNKSEKIYFTK